MNFKGKDCVSHVLHHLAGMDKHILQVSTFVTPFLPSTQSMISDTFMREKSGRFVEVSVMEQTLWKFPNSQ